MFNGKLCAGVAAVAVLAGFGAAFAQRLPEDRQERQRLIETFMIQYQVPLDVCAAAGPEALERMDVLISSVRRAHERVFELVEREPGYIAAVDAHRLVLPGWLRVINVPEECAHRAMLLQRPDVQKRNEEFLDYLLQFLSTPV